MTVHQSRGLASGLRESQIANTSFDEKAYVLIVKSTVIEHQDKWNVHKSKNHEDEDEPHHLLMV